MKNILLAFLIISLFSGCDTEPQITHLNYQNMVILSDLSSRVTNTRFPQKDIKEIKQLIKSFVTDCVKPGKKIGDRSSIIFSAISEKNKAGIDLDTITDISTKMSFINSTGKYKNSGLLAKLTELEDTVKAYYKNVVNPGLDLISLLIEKIENQHIIKQATFATDGVDTTHVHFENHLYIFTDGYLEYASAAKARNSQFYFGNEEIERIRKYCTANNVGIASALKTQKYFRLPAHKSLKNKNVVLHILETQERDKDIKLGSYSHELGLRDNEILEAVWRKWATDSGFKKLTWEKY